MERGQKLFLYFSIYFCKEPQHAKQKAKSYMTKFNVERV